MWAASVIGPVPFAGALVVAFGVVESFLNDRPILDAA